MRMNRWFSRTAPGTRFARTPGLRETVDQRLAGPRAGSCPRPSTLDARARHGRTRCRLTGAERSGTLRPCSRGLRWRGLDRHAMTMLAGNQQTVVDAALWRSGEYWTVVFAGSEVRVRDSRGMRHLAMLLAAPDREVAAAQLDVVSAPKQSGSRTPSPTPADRPRPPRQSKNC